MNHDTHTERCNSEASVVGYAGAELPSGLRSTFVLLTCEKLKVLLALFVT